MVIIEETPFNIRNIFESLNLLVKRKAEEKKLQLEYNTGSNIPASLIGDPTRLIQILLNLTDNAIKFTEKGTVTVTANLKQETADTATIEFEVRDTGRGIPADKQSAVFERFIQASSKTTRLHGGTGLGLSIVKSLVELQHGTIVLKSEVGKGSAFTFTISYKKGSEQQPAPQPSETSKPMNDSERAHPLQILLAEDNKMNQSLVKYVLGKYGIETDVAGDGETATDKMRLKKYDLVLMDIQMPLMDGYEATKIIREELHSNVPIIALTAHAMNDEKERCFNLGMNDYISKPFDPAELYQKISALCPA
jgi:CheY-like chemotaxis protein/anti-sigma regulatory factor (Ser/Thr protein kinase)